MNVFNSLAGISFYALLTGILVTAFLTVTVRNLFHAAIFLAFTLLGIAGIYFILHAEFLAAVQILLYVGAIMTLVIFAIMLTSHMGDPLTPQTNRQKYPVLIALAGLGALLACFTHRTGRRDRHFKGRSVIPPPVCREHIQKQCQTPAVPDTAGYEKRGFAPYGANK